MYRVKSIMGDTAFQVIKEPGVIVRTFYTENAAKEFCDRLTIEEYFGAGRTYVKNYGKCPMCMDCPDGCPLDK